MAGTLEVEQMRQQLAALTRENENQRAQNTQLTEQIARLGTLIKIWHGEYPF